MKLAYRFIAILISSTLALSCSFSTSNNNKSTAFAYFWTNNEADSVNSLFIDGAGQGSLPYSAEKPGDKTEPRGFPTIPVHLKPGVYELEVKAPNNGTVCTGTLLIRLEKHTTEIKSTWTCPGYQVMVVIDQGDRK
ncbi:MAG: hypothetical protein ABWZ25_00645 [Chitinophagaceae bacterium]